MGIFGNQYSGSVTFDMPILEGYGHEEQGELRIIREAYEEQLEVVKALHAIDMAELEGVREGSYDAEILMENALSNAWTKIKEFFKKMWQKVKSYFAALVRMFDGLTKSTKDFVKKYEKDLKKLELDGYEYKMYKYDNSELENGSKISDAFKRVSDHIEGMSTEDVKKKSNEDFEEAIRGAIIGGGKLSTEDYNEKLFSNFRSGATGESEMDDVKVDIFEIISTISNTKAAENAKKAEKAMDDMFKKKIKEIEAQEKDYAKAKDSDTQQEDLKMAQGGISLYTTGKTEALKFFSAWTKAIKERDGVYKRVCTKAFSYKKKA